MALSQEELQTAYKAAIGWYPAGELTTTQLVQDTYKNIAGTDTPDQEGLAYWVDQLDSGALPVADYRQTFKTAADNAAAAETVVPEGGGTTVVPEGGGTTVVPEGGGTTVVPADNSTWQAGLLDLFQPSLTPSSTTSSVTGSTTASENQSQNQAENQSTNRALSEAQNQSTSQSQNQSTSQSQNQSTSQSQNQSTSDAANQSTNESGIGDWFTDPLLEGLLPSLQDSVSDLPGQVDEWADKNLAASRSASKNLLDGHMTNLLADLSKSGMVGSSVASDAISSAGVDAMKEQSATDLGIMSNADAMRLQVPGLLTSVADLGQQSTGQSTGYSTGQSTGSSYGQSTGSSSSQSTGSSSGQSTGSSSSISSGQSTGSSSGSSTGSSTGSSSGVSTGDTTDPLAPYELYSNMLLGMM